MTILYTVKSIHQEHIDRPYISLFLKKLFKPPVFVLEGYYLGESNTDHGAFIM